MSHFRVVKELQGLAAIEARNHNVEPSIVLEVVYDHSTGRGE